MRFFEFAQDPLIPKLVATSDQLRTDLDSGDVASTMTTDQLLQYFQKYDIMLDKSDLYNMIKKEPLNHLIANIQGDQVRFKGFDTMDQPEDEKKKIVKQMANKAAQNIAK